MPVGLKFGRNVSNFNLGIGFGLDFNYHLSDTHTILGEDDNFTTTTVGGKWTKPSLHTAISFGYPFANRWFVHSRIMYRNISIEDIEFDNVIKESYRLYGIDLGLKFRF